MSSLEPVLRFAMLRAPSPPRVNLAFHPVPELDLTDLVAGLRDLRGGANPDRGALVGRARLFLSGPGFTADPESLPLAFEVARITERLTDSGRISIPTAVSIVEATCGHSPQQWVRTAEYAAGRHAAADAIIALSIADHPARRHMARYEHHFRILELVRHVAEGSREIEGVTLAQVLRMPLQLPMEIFPLPPEARPAAIEGTTSQVDDGVPVLRARLHSLERALSDVLNVRSFERRPEAGRGLGSVVVDRRSQEKLSPSSKSVITSLGIDMENEPFTAVLERLESDRLRVSESLRMTAASPTRTQRLRIGTTTLPSPEVELEVDDLTTVPEPFSPVSPAGVMSLLVTRQHIVRYEAGEIAHVENVMQSESRGRETRRLERTEETFTLETEQTSETERDLQSTDRQELQREVESSLHREQQFRIGFTLGASFGPVVSEASTEFETLNASDESSRTASTFAREVTEHAAERVTARTRQEQTTRTLREYEEQNKHGFDNTAGDGHVVGIYQWLNKVYELQVYDYGIRLAFDFVVPRPSAFLRQVIELELLAGEGGGPPEPFDITADSITLDNYNELAARWQATGLTPPPPTYTVVAHSFSRELSVAAPAGDEEAPPSGPRAFAATATLNIPKGYMAWAAFFQAAGTGSGLPPLPDGGINLPHMTLHVGGIEAQVEGLGGSNATFTFLNWERDSVPVAIVGSEVSAGIASVEVWCIRTNDAVVDWRMRTYDTLIGAYRERVSEYEARLAAAVAQRGVQITGRNPLENRRIERDELMRLSIAMIGDEDFAGTHVRLFGRYANRFNPDEANRKGRYMRFWNEAFDWDNMIHELLPYVWSRRLSWWRQLLIEDTDPEHAAFLRAGAAKVFLTVTPGYERAVLHFLETGEVWSGGPQPVLASTKHAAMLDEVERRRVLPVAQETPIGDPWQVTLPTTLVRLRPDNTMPEWTRDEDGNWHAVPS